MGALLLVVGYVIASMSASEEFYAFYLAPPSKHRNMSADDKKKSFGPTFNDKAEISRISEQKIIDLTNQFYLEMSKNILSEIEFEIMKKIPYTIDVVTFKNLKVIPILIIF